MDAKLSSYYKPEQVIVSIPCPGGGILEFVFDDPTWSQRDALERLVRYWNDGVKSDAAANRLTGAPNV